jgi:hypothetical protein
MELKFNSVESRLLEGSKPGSMLGSICGSNPGRPMHFKYLKLSKCPSLTEFLTAIPRNLTANLASQPSLELKIGEGWFYGVLLA